MIGTICRYNTHLKDTTVLREKKAKMMGINQSDNVIQCAHLVHFLPHGIRRLLELDVRDPPFNDNPCHCGFLHFFTHDSPN